MNTHTAKRHPLIAKLLTTRIALGLQQIDVAEAGGLNRNTVGSIESGKRNPSLDMFTRYCAGLGYRLEVVPIDSASKVTAVTADGTYTVPQAAHRLQLSEVAVFALLKDGKLGSIKNGRYRRFTEEHIQQYLDSVGGA